MADDELGRDDDHLQEQPGTSHEQGAGDPTDLGPTLALARVAPPSGSEQLSRELVRDLVRNVRPMPPTVTPGLGPVATALGRAGAGLLAGASLYLVYKTVEAVEQGEKTPLEVADDYYGTHFGDIYGWINGEYTSRDQAREKQRQLNKAATDAGTLDESAPDSHAVPCQKEKARPAVSSDEDEQKKKRYTVAVHAQGKDCGGKTSSTIAAPAVTLPHPVPVAEGLALSGRTQALLDRTQLKVREEPIQKAHQYIQKGPSVGGRFGKKSFPVLGVKGGLRYDVDCHGDGNSFVS